MILLLIKEQISMATRHKLPKVLSDHSWLEKTNGSVWKLSVLDWNIWNHVAVQIICTKNCYFSLVDEQVSTMTQHRLIKALQVILEGRKWMDFNSDSDLDIDSNGSKPSFYTLDSNTIGGLMDFLFFDNFIGPHGNDSN